MPALLTLENISKRYPMAGQEGAALDNVSLSVQSGESVAIMGPSGSGKTTLMHIIGCLDAPSDGRYTLNGVEVSALPEVALTQVRRQQVGFVFQNYNLITTLNAEENVALPLLYQRLSPAEQRDRAEAALERVGLKNRMRYRPNQLSGGQQQRVAVARALVTTAPLILADEPTGNLDTQTGKDVLGLFQDLAQEGHTIIMITHDREVAGFSRRMVEIRDGHIVADHEVTA